MKQLFLLIGILQLAASSVCVAQSSPAFTLTIVPTNYAGGPERATISLHKRFHVLLTNTSPDSLAIYEEWNSWGYYGLSFEITYPDGRKVASYKGLRYWTKNFPSTITIAPHGCYVFDVDFEPDSTAGGVWVNSIRKEPGFTQNGICCRMRAIYSIHDEKDPPPHFLYFTKTRPA
ncbi:MAG: hypothetical protein ACRYFX_10665 [Janthinobacterium lividum]